MKQPGANDKLLAGLDRVTVELNLGQRFATENPDRRVQAQRLENDRFAKNKLRQIFRTRNASGQNGIDLFLKFFLRSFIASKKPQSASECLRSRYVTGENESSQLFAQLMIGHSRLAAIARA